MEEKTEAYKCLCGHHLGQHLVTSTCLVPGCSCLGFRVMKRVSLKRKSKVAPEEYRPISERERYAAYRLSECTFLPASWDKRFAGSMAHIQLVTERQTHNLWRSVYRYRRQIGDKDLVAEAKERAGV